MDYFGGERTKEQIVSEPAGVRKDLLKVPLSRETVTSRDRPDI